MNVSRSGVIVAVEDSILANVSRFGVAVGQVEVLGGDDFTKARAPKWARMIKLPKRDAHAAIPSSNYSPTQRRVRPGQHGNGKRIFMKMRRYRLGKS